MKVNSTATFDEHQVNCDTQHTFSGDIPAQTTRESDMQRKLRMDVPLISVNIVQPERIV